MVRCDPPVLLTAALLMLMLLLYCPDSVLPLCLCAGSGFSILFSDSIPPWSVGANFAWFYLPADSESDSSLM